VDANYSFELPQAFVVGEDELKKLIRLLIDRIGDPEIRADCADDIARTFKTLSELVAFENSPGKEIRRLHIAARSADFAKRATIDLSGWRWRGISLDFHARDDVVSRLRTEVLDIVAGMRPWYSGLHRVNFILLLFCAFLLVDLGMLAAINLRWILVGDSTEMNSTRLVHAFGLGELIAFGGSAVLLALGLLLNRFRVTVFPSGVFLIGQGKARFQHLEPCHWGVVIAFVVSFAAGLVIFVWQSIAA
jgi:hypothetical protein